MKLIFSILLLTVTIIINAQQTTGKLQPGESYSNQSDEVVFYMPKSKVVKLLNYQTTAEFEAMRVDKYKEMVSNLELRIIESDSSINLHAYEADYWKMQLEKNDRELEEAKIQKETLIYENNKIRKSRLYFFVGGIVATSILFIAVK